MQAVLLVGGREGRFGASRLGSLSKRCPKPLLPVGDRPFLDYVIDNLERFGVDEIVLLAGYRAELIEAFARGRPNVSVVAEAKPLGTAGALRHAQARLAPSFLLVKGDCLFDIDYSELATPPTDRATDRATGRDWRVRVALRREADAARHAVVSLEDDGRISRIAAPTKREGPGLIIGGSCWMDRRVVEAIPSGRCSLEKSVFPDLARQGLLFGSVYEGGFIDIGIPEGYVFAQTWVPAVFDLMRGEAVSQAAYAEPDLLEPADPETERGSSAPVGE